MRAHRAAGRSCKLHEGARAEFGRVDNLRVFDADGQRILMGIASGGVAVMWRLGTREQLALAQRDADAENMTAIPLP